MYSSEVSHHSHHSPTCMTSSRSSPLAQALATESQASPSSLQAFIMLFCYCSASLVSSESTQELCSYPLAAGMDSLSSEDGLPSAIWHCAMLGKCMMEHQGDSFFCLLTWWSQLLAFSIRWRYFLGEFYPTLPG